MEQDLDQLITTADTIYFVCSGNIIRSSFAELYARHLGIDNVSSYGTTYHNKHIHQRSAEKLHEIGVESQVIDNFSPTHLNATAQFTDNDIHIVMTTEHRDKLIAAGVSPNRILKIRELIGDDADVADPYFQNNFDEAYDTIVAAVKQLSSYLS